MRTSIATTLLLAIIFAVCASQQIPTSQSAAVSVSQSPPPAKRVSDGARGTIEPGRTLEFKQLKISVLTTTVDSSAATPQVFASIRLKEGGATKEWTAHERVSCNWRGYHIAIASIHGPDEPGGGRVELSVATVASLPQCIGKPIGEDSPWPCR